MRNVLIIALEVPNPLLPRSLSFDYGFPRTALLIASCVQKWGAKAGFFPRLLNVDAAIQAKVKKGATRKEVENTHQEILAHAIRKHDPELICIVAPYTNLGNWLLQTARVCRKKNPKSLIITGGLHASFVASSLLKGSDSVFDAIVLGPGESKLKHILENFDSPSSRFNYPGISSKENPVKFSIEAQLNDVEIPHIDYSLIDPQDIGNSGAVIITSYGCLYSCQFCLESIYWRKARKKHDADLVREEIINLSRLGVPVFGCGDSNIDMRENRFEEFCLKAFAGLDLHEHFFILNRLHMLNARGCKAFRQAGGRAVWVGIETASTELLIAMGKGEVPHILKNKLEIPKKYGLRVGAFFMFGYPGETAETAKMTLRLMKELLTKGFLDYVDPSVFVPYPGLPMYEAPEAYGIKWYKPYWRNWEHWERYNVPPVYDLATLSRNEIFQFWKEAMDIKWAMDIRDKVHKGDRS